MTDRGLPVDASIEPTREVLRRMWLYGNSMSIRDHEPHLIEQAKKLAREGWLIDCGAYSFAAGSYHQFKPSEKLDRKALKDI